MRYEFITTRAFAVGEDLREGWDALVDRVPDARFSHRPAWIRATDRFRPEGRISVHAAFVGRELVAVGAVEQKRATVHGLRCDLRLGPAQDPSHFTDLLIAPEHRTGAFVDAWLAHLTRADGSWDAVRFPRIPASGALLQALDDADVAHAHCDPRPSRVVDVTHPERLDRLSRRQMRNLDRLARRIRREVGPLRRRTWTRPDDILLGFDIFLTLEASGWKGDWEHLSALAYRPRGRDFYESALRDLAAVGAARVDVLYGGERPMSAQIALRGGESWYLLKIGYDEAFRRFGPGGLLFRDFLREAAADDGVRRVNLVTAPAWSDRWHMDDEVAVDLWIYGSTRRGQLLLAERGIQDRARVALGRGGPRLAS